MNNGADVRRRELTIIDIETKAKKKSLATKVQKAEGSASARPKTASAKADGAKKTTGQAIADAKSAGAAKPAAKASQKAAKPAAKADLAMTNGTQKRASSSNASKPKKTAKATGGKKANVEENPLSRRSSAVLFAADAPEVAPAVRPARRRPAGNDKLRSQAQPKSRRQNVRRPENVRSRVKQAEEAARRNAPHKKARRKKRKKVSAGAIVLMLLLMMGIGAAGAVGYYCYEGYEEFTQMKAVVARQTFFDGTIVDGINVGGMTLEDTVNYFSAQVEPVYRERAAVLNDGTRITAGQMGYSSDYETVLRNAWNAGRSGTLEERYAHIVDHNNAPASYTVQRSMYDGSVVSQYAWMLAEQIDRKSVDAKVRSFDIDSYEFSFESEQVGYSLDQLALKTDIEAALDAGGGNVNLQIRTLQPENTVENIRDKYGMITQAVTNASSSSSNRLSNIRLSLEAINGYCLKPGETFSFNEVVGQRTKSRGYKEATAYSSGEVTEQVGGGICQVSTTLFNAAVKADLEIKERHNHSLTVSYVDLGKDAAVNWNSQDLRFTNTSEDNIYLVCYLTDDKRVRIGVFGRLLENGMTITVEGRQTGTIDFEQELRLNMTMSSGEMRVVEEGKIGYTAVAYKIYHDANGNEIHREELCKSRYMARNQIVEYGP